MWQVSALQPCFRLCQICTCQLVTFHTGCIFSWVLYRHRPCITLLHQDMSCMLCRRMKTPCRCCSITVDCQLLKFGSNDRPQENKNGIFFISNIALPCTNIDKTACLYQNTVTQQDLLRPTFRRLVKFRVLSPMNILTPRTTTTKPVCPFRYCTKLYTESAACRFSSFRACCAQSVPVCCTSHDYHSPSSVLTMMFDALQP